MVKMVRVSSIAVAAPAHHPSDVGQPAVDEMISFWRQQFSQVLPDRPDIIAVPECCDRFGGHAAPEAAVELASAVPSLAAGMGRPRL